MSLNTLSTALQHVYLQWITPSAFFRHFFKLEMIPSTCFGEGAMTWRHYGYAQFLTFKGPIPGLQCFLSVGYLWESSAYIDLIAVATGFNTFQVKQWSKSMWGGIVMFGSILESNFWHICDIFLYLACNQTTRPMDSLARSWQLGQYIPDTSARRYNYTGCLSSC